MTERQRSNSTFSIPMPKPVPRPTVLPKQKCGTCAYRTPMRTEDWECSIAYYMESQQQAHPCHERRGVFCLGSHEVTQAIESEVLLKFRSKPFANKGEKNG